MTTRSVPPTVSRATSGSSWTPCPVTSPCSHRTSRWNGCGRSRNRCWRTRPRSSRTPLAHGARSHHSTASPRRTSGICHAAAHQRKSLLPARRVHGRSGTTSALRLRGGEPVIVSAKRRRQASELVSRVDHADVTRAQALIERVSAQGVRLITILDEDYPEHLRLIFNRPPFIWVRGRLESRNLRAIAMVGTRQASQEGRAAAARLPRGLATAGGPVLAGLARGIDTAAHAATLEAGGTTVAVIGTGILAPVDPPENGARAPRIVGRGGALVSPLWP